MNTYEEKRQRKIDHAREMITKSETESQNRYETARKIGSFIPMGQPILVGHHSEARHRRDINRIDTNMRKSIEADEKAKYYRDKVARMENNTVISSDDPDALTKLEEKLTRLQANHEVMKESNRIIKSKKILEVEKIDQLINMGFTATQANELLNPAKFGGLGFAGFQLSNNNQNMATVKQRIEQLRQRATQETTEKEINGVKIVNNIEENRLQAFFPGIPPADIRDKLKHSGFRWSPSNGCWQAYRKQWNLDRLKEIISTINA